MENITPVEYIVTLEIVVKGTSRQDTLDKASKIIQPLVDTGQIRDFLLYDAVEEMTLEQ